MKRILRIGIRCASIFTVILIFASCVSQRSYEELLNEREKCLEDNEFTKGKNDELSTKVTEQAADIERMEMQIRALKTDTASLGKSYRQATSSHDRLSKTYETLLQRNKDLLEGKQTETQSILMELQMAQTNLQKKEDELTMMEKELNVKKESLDQLSMAMQSKEKKLLELQTILSKKDSVVNRLRGKVTDALLGFENKGLTIQQKNGKVYVSLEENLLFTSGSFAVDPKGVNALKKLAKVLEENTDINVMIEGHTDDVPYNGSGQIKDNWDLSVMRATAIVKILLHNSNISPKRLTAAGRGEYHPIDPAKTSEARSKNRRTEIILTPKLDELFQIIETN